MKNKLIKSTLILVIGGLVTKLLGMIIRIMMSRELGTEGIGLYMLLMPTFTLLIALGQAGLPIAISKLVSEESRNNKKLVFGIIPIALLINLIIITIVIILSPFIANNLLKQPKLTNAIICMGLVLPFIAISSILRGYFFGKERMFPHVISNVIEDIIRLIIIVIGIPIFLKNGIESAICFVILSNIISELTSIIILFVFLPKHFKVNKTDFIPNYQNTRDIFKVSLPATGSRIIGSIGYFLEPIIITYVLSMIGYSSSYIVYEYGIINGYVIPLVLLPSFFSMAISSALLPIISKSYKERKYKYTSTKIKQAIGFSLLIGIPFTIVIMVYPSLPLKLLYNTNEGINYIRLLAPLCLFEYIQSPLTSSLQAMNKAHEAMMGTLIGMIIRTISLILLSLLHIGLYGLIISDGLNMIYVTIHHYKKIKKHLAS